MKRVFLALVLALLWCTSAVAAPLSWQWRSSLPQANALYDITYGGGQFVAVGAGGAVVTSSDGKTWAWHPAGVDVSLRSVIYADGRYVAVGVWQGAGGEQGVIVTSADGVTWRHTEMGAGSALSGVAYGGSQFVAVGTGDATAGSTILTSADGQTWMPTTAQVAEGVKGIAYGGGRFVAFGADAVVVSEDGKTWTAGRMPERTGILRLIHTGAGFAGIGTHLHEDSIHWDSVLLRSTDGQEWTMQTVGQQRPFGLTYADGQYLATAAGGLIQTSTDGATWQTYSTAANTELNAIACGGQGACVAVGANGKLVTATDRVHWSDVGVTPAGISINDLAYGNGQFVGVKGANEYISPDGEQWAGVTPQNLLLSVTHANGRFFANSSSGNGRPLLVSNDARTWQQVAHTGSASSDVAYGKGRYVVVSQGVTVLSADLKPLGAAPSSETAFIMGVVYGKGLFVGVGGDRIAYSPDGLAWTQAASLPGDSGLFQVAYGGGRFVAVGFRDAALVYTSTDGKQWTKVEPGGSRLLGVVYGGGRFLAWSQGSILTSVDGEHWTAEPNRAGAALLAYGAGKFIAVGEGGTLMTATGCGARFPDVAAGHPACDAVEQLTERQIVAGHPDGTFRPDTSLTRAEVAKMLALTMGLKPDPQGRVPFSDSAQHWAAQTGYLQAAVSAGIINGFPDGTFRPDVPVTRGELTKMVAAAAGLKPEPPGAAYSDIRGSDWFANWAGAARSADLIGTGGYHALWGGAEFRGGASASRGDAAILMDNLANH